MKPPPFDYAAPDTIDEAVRLLAADGDAKPLAGGQSLLPLLNFRLAAPSLLVDLRRIEALRAIARTGESVRIGAMVTQRTAEDDAELARDVPLLREALRFVAHPQIRSRGTVGGSIVHADPAAELPAVLVALDGRVHVRSDGGERTIEAADLYEGFLTTSLAPGEVATAVELPAAQPGTRTACIEVAQRRGDYALCGAVVQVTRNGESLADARIALFGVGQRPVRARSVEGRLLAGDPPSVELVRDAALRASDGLEPQTDRQASADYRRHLARVLVRRGLEQALELAA